MRRFAVLVLTTLTASVLGALPAGASPDGVAVSTADLTGAAERPGPADPDGSGWAQIVSVPELGLLCYVILVDDITLPAAAAHIHVAGPSVPGPIVVGLEAPNRAGVSAGCVRGVDEELLEAIAEHPEAYYVNVHTSDYPGGAVRGQLEEE